MIVLASNPRTIKFENPDPDPVSSEISDLCEKSDLVRNFARLVKRNFWTLQNFWPIQVKSSHDCAV